MEVNMSRYFIVCLIICFCFNSVIVYAEETEHERIEREAAERHMNHIKDEFESMDVDIQFYGKVLDQNNNPVESADVLFHTMRFSPVVQMFFGESKDMQAKTDAQGCFSVVGEKGRSIYFDKIIKDGYEFSLSQNRERGFDYSGVRDPFIPDQNHPIVFHLRKKGETTFLIREIEMDLCINAKKSGITKGADLVREINIDDISKMTFNGEKLYCDLKVKANFDADTATWTAVIMPGDANGGVIASDQLLYEAPEEGYQSESVFIAEDFKTPEKKYIYLKSRDPAIYTRIDIEDFSANKEYFCLHGQSVTNPYGDRNLEQATDLPFAVDKQLSDEIRSAYRKNKRPVKPDLQKLINEAKGKTSQ
jgi:hypothetical protein